MEYEDLIIDLCVDDDDYWDADDDFETHMQWETAQWRFI